MIPAILTSLSVAELMTRKWEKESEVKVMKVFLMAWVCKVHGTRNVLCNLRCIKRVCHDGWRYMCFKFRAAQETELESDLYYCGGDGVSTCGYSALDLHDAGGVKFEFDWVRRIVTYNCLNTAFPQTVLEMSNLVNLCVPPSPFSDIFREKFFHVSVVLST